MIIRAITREEICSIKPPWESLNAHHLPSLTHLKDHFPRLKFEKRIEGLKKRMGNVRGVTAATLSVSRLTVQYRRHIVPAHALPADRESRYLPTTPRSGTGQQRH